MQGYYRVIPDYITRDKRLNNGEKIFFSFLSSLISKKGYCWATNKYLAKESDVSISQVQRYLRKLALVKLIIIETECHTYRKIWTRESFNNKDILEETYGPDEFNQTFTTSVMDDRGVGHLRPTPAIYKVKTNKINKEKVVGNIYTEASQAPPPPPASSFEKMSEEQEQQLIKEAGKVKAARYAANAKRTLTSKRFAGSELAKMSHFDLAMKFYKEDLVNRSQETPTNRKENMDTVEQNRENINKFLNKNQHLKKHIEVSRNEVIAGEIRVIEFRDKDFMDQLYERLNQMQMKYTPFGEDYPSPTKRPDQSEKAGL